MLLASEIQGLTARLALNDDAAAYKQLFLYYHPRLLSFSYAITHCRESSEEAVSDVFLKIWNSRRGLLRIANLHLYLYISTKNTSLNYLAAQKRSQVLNLDEVKTEFTSLQYNPQANRKFFLGEMKAPAKGNCLTHFFQGNAHLVFHCFWGEMKQLRHLFIRKAVFLHQLKNKLATCLSPELSSLLKKIFRSASGKTVRRGVCPA